jgi:general stress protein 26
MNSMNQDFDEQLVLTQPLMLHLATVCEEGPRSSPLWFLYEDKKLWLFGMREDSFVKRLQQDSRVALSVVDFDLQSGLLRHVGIRGLATITDVDTDILKRFVGKYLGHDTTTWDAWFIENIISPLDAMIEVQALTLVAKDASFFKNRSLS